MPFNSDHVAMWALTFFALRSPISRPSRACRDAAPGGEDLRGGAASRSKHLSNAALLTVSRSVPSQSLNADTRTTSCKGNSNTLEGTGGKMLDRMCLTLMTDTYGYHLASPFQQLPMTCLHQCVEHPETMRMAHIGPHISRHCGADVMNCDNIALCRFSVTDEIVVLSQCRRCRGK